VSVLVGAVSTASAQQPPAAAPAIERVPLTAGRSTVLTTDFDITRVAVTDPAIADATVVQPREILIDGKMPGTVSLIIWGAAERRQYDLVVEPGVSTLEQRLQALFPGEDIRVTATGDAVILAGRVSSNDVSLRAAEIATATASKAKVVNLLQLPGGAGSQQVLLKVRFAEVSRRALTEVGVSLSRARPGSTTRIGRVTTGQFGAPNFANLETTKASSSFGAEVQSASGEFTFGDFLNIFLFNQKYDLGALIKALRGRGLFQSLAEPNLIAYNGRKPASWRAAKFRFRRFRATPALSASRIRNTGFD
jgi:pilus assembly protein CpaC